jgi:hypothetical protein
MLSTLTFFKKVGVLSKDWFKAGNKVIIIANTSAHLFDIGTVVVLGEQHHDAVHKEYRRASFGLDKWWIRVGDCTPYEFDLEAKVKELLG